MHKSKENIKKTIVLVICIDIYNTECTVMPWYLKAVWVQFNINTPVALVITILFYLFIPNGRQYTEVKKCITNRNIRQTEMISYLKKIIALIIYFFHPNNN